MATSAGGAHLSFNPLVWVKNVGMMLPAVFFFGNTVPVIVEASLFEITWMSLNLLLVVLALGYGLWLSYVSSKPQSSLIFVVAAFPMTFFPMLLLGHISEIYLTAIVLGLALMTGLAVHGWTTVSTPLRYVVLLFAVSQLLLASSAIQNKVAGMNEAGERTAAMMRKLLKQVPNDGHEKRVAIIFLHDDSVRTKSYSIFVMRDDQLLQHSPTYAIRWFSPDRPVRVDHQVVADPSEVNVKAYDLALLWDSSAKDFTPMVRQER
jgi:hypothetical protein